MKMSGVPACTNKLLEGIRISIRGPSSAPNDVPRRPPTCYRPPGTTRARTRISELPQTGKLSNRSCLTVLLIRCVTSRSRCG
ncbi:hypothetical protein J6590_047645 [Homalodisca vitripennis]|nr:hypothetical protein J6590_047645 [Homalodisca vitripennis]